MINISLKTATCLSFLCLITTCKIQAQEVISKLEIKVKEVYLVKPDNILLVDTLIMHDKAVIQFNQGSPAFMGVNTAFIGKDCKLITKGTDGSLSENNTESLNGNDGSSLEMDIHFETLGSLTIDARGGSGGKGRDGNVEVPSTSKSDGDGTFKSIAPVKASVSGGAGGNGGDGGNVSFTYSTNRFIPRFNQYRKHNSIIILTQGGKGGKPGDLGKIEGRAGTDGQIKLVNKNLPSEPSHRQLP